MAYRNKTYVAFDGDTDIKYYRTMQMWKQSDSSEFNFYDAHDLNNALDTSSEETIKRKLRDRMANSKVFVLLVGEGTRHLYKFVRWEIEQAIRLNLPIIVVNLPKIAGTEGKRNMDSERCPKIAREALAIHISFRSKILQYALENWPESHKLYKKENESGPYYYKSSVYEKLGL
ncbi:TIR domain-containing protein [Enterococcus italicus]|uniref:TIR domain-containing protein n=1 Tax=Enterococcus italicus TaxID=246144 RepID=UPI002073BEFA|nr:TIR domain-containing protein [Enterococcus italicus]MCM6881691.1 TIR domain-containing protein [Enterococcus italicus]